MAVKERSLIGGILSIVSGGFGVLTGVGIALFSILLLNTIFSAPSFRGNAPPDEFLLIMKLVYGGMGVFYALVGALSIVGGIMAVKRKNWGLALAGAIAASVAFYPVGIAAVIFVSMSQPEFVTPNASVSDPSTPAGG
jgi:hypothetical protein